MSTNLQEGETNDITLDHGKLAHDQMNGTTTDSSTDSGHERASSSTSSSIDLCDRDDIGGDEKQESFVDAPDDFLSNEQHRQNNDDDDCCRKPRPVAVAIADLTDGSSTKPHEDGSTMSDEPNNGTRAELRVRLQETSLIMKMALNNEFNKALSLCSSRADKELYASLATATLSFLRAALTLEQADLQVALHSINQSFEVSSTRRRKTSTVSMMARFLYKPNYNSYTDDEIHAELVNAESLLLLALISFLSDQSIICLVRGAFRIRTCYQRYKECLYIMENRRHWSSDEAREHFESGVRMGYGIFNLLMSYLPRRVLRFLEYVGFSGNRSIGVEELEKSISLADGLRSVFSALVILAYHSYIENLFGLGSYDSQKVEELNSSLLADYPNSAFFLLFLGRYDQMEGNLDEAIRSFERCIAAQDDWKQFHSICHWEMMWCYAVRMDWDRAAHYSDLLRKRSKWSAASYTYQYATFLYAKLVEDERKGLCQVGDPDYSNRMQEIREIMEQVPKLRIRYAGKTIPAEKFAITRSIKFCEQNNRLTLPALEFLYIWNVFVTLRNSPKQVEFLLDRINSEIEHIEAKQIEQAKLEDEQQQQQDSSDTNDDDDEEPPPTTPTSENSSLDHRKQQQPASSSSEDEGGSAEEGMLQSLDNWDDDLNLTVLLKGMCLKHLSRLDEAQECFMVVINNESDIELDTFIVPHTAMELALLNLTKKQYSAARRWVKKAKNDYTGYLLETIVHFRLHAASRIIRMEEQDLELNSSGESQPDSKNNN